MAAWRGAWSLGPVAVVLLTAAVGRAGSDGPRVVRAWPSGLMELRVAFDRPVGAELARAAVGRSIPFDTRRRTLADRPSRATGADDPDARGSIRIAAARLVDGGRTLVLTTDPHPRAAVYRLSLAADRATPIEREYDLSGVEAAWSPGGEDAPPSWTAWWPTPDPGAAERLLAGSAGHARELADLGRPGRLTLSTLVCLPPGPATLAVASDVPVEATLGGENPEPPAGAPGAATGPAVFRVESTGEPTLLSVTRPTRANDPAPRLRVTARSGAGPESLLPPGKFLLPWVPPEPPPPAPLENVPDLKGGDPVRGRAVFRGAEARCSSCHKLRGEGADVGPDLSGLVGRDRLAVYRDVAEPSARVHPDYVSFTVALKDGRVLVGTVRADGADAVRVTDTAAQVTVVRRVEVEEFRPSATSIMPVGLAGAIGPDRLRDLLAFLTTAPAK